MKFLDKLALKIFSLIIIVLAVIVTLLVLGIINLKTIENCIIVLSDGEISLKILLGTIAVLILLALKGLFFTSKPENEGKTGIILENSNGKLVISKESLENLIASVIKEVPGADSVSSRTILDRDKNLIVYVTALVSKDVMIKDVSNELQEKIKLAMKQTADLDVKEVNIKIKNITNKKVKSLPAGSESVVESETQSSMEEVGQEIDNLNANLDEENNKEE